MVCRWELRFAPSVGPGERGEIQAALSPGLSEEQRILPHQSRVKAFYRLESSVRPIFVKARFFRSWHRRLGRTFRQTKEERELAHYLALRARGIPCPEPLATARLRRVFWVEGSLLLTEFLPHAVSLRIALQDPGSFPTEEVLDRLADFLALLRSRGVVHEDLQWDNLLWGSGGDGPTIHLVDPLHVRWGGEEGDSGFASSLAWFVHFMRAGEAPAPIVEGFLERVGDRKLAAPRDRAWLVAEARRMGER